MNIKNIIKGKESYIMKTMKAKLTLFIALFALISVFTPNVKAEAATVTPAKPTGLGLYTSGFDINLYTGTYTINKNKFHLSWDWDANLPYYNSDPSSYYYGYFGYEVNVTTLKNKKIAEQDFPVTSSDLYSLSAQNKMFAAITNSKMTKQGFKFKVRSYVIGENNEKVYSDWSAEKVIIPRATVTKTSLVKNNGNKVNIKFSKVSGAKSYTIYLSSNDEKSFKKVGTTTKTNYTISKKFTKGKNYYVYVVANKVKYKKKNYNSTNPIHKIASDRGFVIKTKYVY